MKSIDKFGLEPVPPANNEDDEQSTLVVDKKLTAIALKGLSLDAQFEHEGKFILFVTHDSPYEEFLHIYLLDKNFLTIDEIQMSQNMAQPLQLIGDLQIIEPNQLQFSFFGKDSWLLTVSEKPAFSFPRLPLLSLYWKPARFAFSAGHLQLSKNE